MSRSRRTFTAVLAVTLVLQAQLAYAAQRVYVTPISSENMDPVEARRVQDVLVNRLSAYQSYDLVTESMLKDLLAKSRVRSNFGDDCREGACLGELSKALNASYYIHGSVIGLNESAIVTIELVDANEGRIAARSEWEMPRPITGATQQFHRALDELVAKIGTKGNVLAVAEAKGSTLEVDGKQYPLNDSGRAKFSLLVGDRKFKLTHPDYAPVEEYIFVKGTQTVWQPNQFTYEELETPWYLAWWFWATVAAVTAGGVGAYFALRPEPAEAEELEPLPPLKTGGIGVSF